MSAPVNTSQAENRLVRIAIRCPEPGYPLVIERRVTESDEAIERAALEAALLICWAKGAGHDTLHAVEITQLS